MITRFVSWLAATFHWDSQPDPLTPPNMPPNAPPQPFPTFPESVSPNALKLVQAAKECLGQNLSAGTGVASYVACAISVNVVHHRAFGVEIGGGASTLELYRVLLKHRDFKEVSEAEAGPGTIIISPTGYGGLPSYPHGHVGILCEHGICANDSAEGVWRETYPDIEAWKDQFETIEGYLTFYFQRI